MIQVCYGNRKKTMSDEFGKTNCMHHTLLATRDAINMTGKERLTLILDWRYDSVSICDDGLSHHDITSIGTSHVLSMIVDDSTPEMKERSAGCWIVYLTANT